MNQGLRLVSLWHFDYHDPATGERWEESVWNLITTEGLNAILSTMFNAGPQSSAWYMGLIANSGFDEILVTDTAAAHAGWDEFLEYLGQRQPLAPLSVAGGIVITTSPLQFTFTTADTVRGGFVINDQAKTGTTGTLWSATSFGTPRQVKQGASLTVRWTLTAAGGT